MANSCCICGTVKNCAPFLDKIFANMETLGALFTDYVIILSYDKSTDGSLKKIKEYKKRNPKVYLYVNREPLFHYRTHNIAKARNKCLQLINAKFNNFEYFIMMDCDDVCSQTVKTGALTHYLQRDDWDGLSFNKNPYYDIWAFSKYPFVLSCHHFRTTRKWKQFADKLMYNTPPKTLIPCLSAFNGFSIYRTSKFINCVYDGRMRIDLFPPNFIEANLLVAGPFTVKNSHGLNEDCEHRAFHMQAIRQYGARIMMAPEIIF